MAQRTQLETPQELEDIVDQLEQDKGWDRVTARNLGELISRALARSNERLAQKLRDWK
jgi:hypothetical protein